MIRLRYLSLLKLLIEQSLKRENDLGVSALSWTILNYHNGLSEQLNLLKSHKTIFDKRNN